MRILFKRSLAFSSALTLLCASGVTLASGFQLWEENAGTLGNNHAGAAAEANSAADEFYNPAGIVRAKHAEVSVGGAFVSANVQFDKGGVVSTLEQSHTLMANESGGNSNFVPNLHIVVPLSKNWHAAFGVTTPFGLATDYTGTAVTQYAATKTQIESFNLNPSLAYAVTNKLSLAAGFDAMYGSAIYDNTNILFEKYYNFTNELSGWGYGYNLGALYQLSPSTRVGLSYRSEVDIDASGPSSQQLIEGDEEPVKTTATANLPMPATSVISVYQKMSKKLSIMASAFYSQWSVLKAVTINNTAVGDITDDKNFKNTWNFALGVNYQVNSHFMMMLGAGYDQSPTKDGYRDIRMPDSDHTTVSLGTEVTVQKNITLNFGYAHIFMPKANVNNSRSKAGQLITEVGQAQANANLMTVQLNWVFQ